MVATLSKNTAGTSWSLSNERSYDVWGSVRSGAVTGGPKGRYVANLGHVADDESGLIYMRARYYEPETGRFVSQDSAKHGLNYYVYCISSPTNYLDEDGRTPTIAQMILSGFGTLIGIATLTVGYEIFVGASAGDFQLQLIGLKTMIAGLWIIEAAYAFSGRGDSIENIGQFVLASWITSWLAQACATVKTHEAYSKGNKVANVALGYGLVLTVLILEAMYGT